MAKRILIVDDEPSIRKVLSAHLRRDGYETLTACDGAEAIAALQEGDFDAVVSDMKMPGVGGLELLRWCTDHRSALPVILITAHGTVDSAVEAIKQGAHDYITKPFDRDDLQRIIAKAVASGQVSRSKVQPAPGRFAIIGQTPSMRKIFDLIARVAPSPPTALITGESGTGKELVARALHQQSDRASGPFITVNCGAIPENLFESELFGHERGAFTGAVQSKPGRFELAHGGTLLLDEVGELPADMQVKLLRVLQERRFERVGGLRSIDVDVRLIAATNRDLAEAARSNDFRQDLYYRLNVIPMHLPPLRERSEDVVLLAKHFLERFNQRLGRQLKGLTPAASDALAAWHWPGNIRELENFMERAVLLADGEWIGLPELPGLTGAKGSPQSSPMEGLPLKDYVRVHTAKLERARIREALQVEHHNVTRAAKRLGISRKSLQTKMKDYGLRED